MPIDQLGVELRARRLTARALVDACLARIDELNPRVTAFTFVDREGARAADAQARGVAIQVVDGLKASAHA